MALLSVAFGVATSMSSSKSGGPNRVNCIVFLMISFLRWGASRHAYQETREPVGECLECVVKRH